MAVLYQSPDLQLPWSSSDREDKRFILFAIIFLVVTFLGGIWIQSITLPEPDRKKLEKVPESLVKIIKKKKEKPKPKPKPKVKKKQPAEKKKDKPKPKKEEVKKAREKVKKLGLLKMKDDLAAMRQAFKPIQNKKLTKEGSKALNVKRSVIMGKATATSGGIQTAAVPSVSGVASIDGRDVTEVDSITLGGSTVEGGDGAADGADLSGTRSEEMIRAVLDQNKGALYAIYNRALRADPTLSGKVTFEIVIEPDGFVSACKIMASDLNDTGLEAKLVSRMKLIDFGAEDVETTTTRWAIDFLPF